MGTGMPEKWGWVMAQRMVLVQRNLETGNIMNECIACGTVYSCDKHEEGCSFCGKDRINCLDFAKHQLQGKCVFCKVKTPKRGWL